jgi:hypothetical protein
LPGSFETAFQPLAAFRFAPMRYAVGRQAQPKIDGREQHVSGLLIGKGFDRGDSQLAGFGELRA